MCYDIFERKKGNVVPLRPLLKIKDLIKKGGGLRA